MSSYYRACFPSLVSWRKCAASVTICADNRGDLFLQGTIGDSSTQPVNFGAPLPPPTGTFSCAYFRTCTLLFTHASSLLTCVCWYPAYGAWQPCVFSPLQLFVGLSFPYEGPAPLEAIANGCAFLNPKFNPSKSSKNTDFFKGKPTLREVRGVQDLSPAARPITFKSFDFPNPPPPLSFLPAADLSAPIRRGVHRSAPRVDGGYREFCRSREGHPLHPQPKGNRGRLKEAKIWCNFTNVIAYLFLQQGQKPLRCCTDTQAFGPTAA